MVEGYGYQCWKLCMILEKTVLPRYKMIEYAGDSHKNTG